MQPGSPRSQSDVVQSPIRRLIPTENAAQERVEGRKKGAHASLLGSGELLPLRDAPHLDFGRLPSYCQDSAG